MKDQPGKGLLGTEVSAELLASIYDVIAESQKLSH